MVICYDIYLNDRIIYTGITSTSLGKRSKGNYRAKMNEAFILYGRENFHWVEVARFDSEDEGMNRYHASMFEGNRIIELDLVNSGCNSYSKGNVLNEETKRKLSQLNKGKIISLETRLKLSNANKGENHPMFGKHHSPDVRQKISERTKEKALKGESHPMFGKHHSPEARQKISEKTKEKALKGVDNPMFGKTLSLEARQKLSEANKGKTPSNYRHDLRSKIPDILKMREEGMTIKTIAEVLNCAYGTVRNLLQQAA